MIFFTFSKSFSVNLIYYKVDSNTFIYQKKFISALEKIYEFQKFKRKNKMFEKIIKLCSFKGFFQHLKNFFFNIDQLQK